MNTLLEKMKDAINENKPLLVRTNSGRGVTTDMVEIYKELTSNSPVVFDIDNIHDVRNVYEYLYDNPNASLILDIHCMDADALMPLLSGLLYAITEVAEDKKKVSFATKEKTLIFTFTGNILCNAHRLDVAKIIPGVKDYVIDNKI